MQITRNTHSALALNSQSLNALRATDFSSLRHFLY